MKFFKRTLIPIIYVFLLISCNTENKSSLEVNFPSEFDIRWSHTIYKYQIGDTTSIGTVNTRSFGTESFQGRSNVINLERRFAFDSLIGTARPIKIQNTYLHDFDGVLSLYGDTYFDLFDGMVPEYVLDSLTTAGSGEDYQRFSFIVPGWIKWINYGNSPETALSSHETYKVFLDFYYREIHITGFVNAYSEIKFDDFDVAFVQDTLRVLTQKYLFRTYYDFSLQKNGVSIPQFRMTTDVLQWIHETGGMIQRERKPISLFIPQVPSREAIVFIPGEIWKLSSFQGFELEGN